MGLACEFGGLGSFRQQYCIRLSDLYFDFDDYNYEANWTWNHKFEWDEGGDVKDQKRSPYLQKWVEDLLIKLRAIKKELNEFEG
jgi:hypothetical protein